MGIAVPVRTCLTTEVVMNTPWPMLGYVHVLHGEIQALRERIEVLEAKLSADSTNSNKPPSSDNPFTKGKEINKSHRKDRKSRKGFRQQALSPTQVTELYPGKCSCGCNTLTDVEPYYVHQVVELPEIKLEVTHFHLASRPVSPLRQNA
jgi:transposase